MSKGFWIIAIVFFLLYSVGKFFFRTLKGFGEGMQNAGSNKNDHFRPADGNVTIDKKPNSTGDKKEGFKGGEYIDYEEL